MLKLHAFLNRKPSSLLPPPCQVEAVVELDAVSFENLLQRPMDDQPQITAHKSLMRCEEGVEHCVLFLGKEVRMASWSIQRDMTGQDTLLSFQAPA